MKLFWGPGWRSTFHRFGVDFGVILGAKWEQKSRKKQSQKRIKKHDCKKVTQDKKGSRGRRNKSPCPPLKEQIPGLATSQGIRDTPLVPSGTVADICLIAKILKVYVLFFTKKIYENVIKNNLKKHKKWSAKVDAGEKRVTRAMRQTTLSSPKTTVPGLATGNKHWH